MLIPCTELIMLIKYVHENMINYGADSDPLNVYIINHTLTLVWLKHVQYYKPSSKTGPALTIWRPEDRRTFEGQVLIE